MQLGLGVNTRSVEMDNQIPAQLDKTQTQINHNHLLGKIQVGTVHSHWQQKQVEYTKTDMDMTQVQTQVYEQGWSEKHRAVPEHSQERKLAFFQPTLNG